LALKLVAHSAVKSAEQMAASWAERSAVLMAGRLAGLMVAY
jgi:hypothetical protein